jgi:hypothetical protein
MHPCTSLSLQAGDRFSHILARCIMERSYPPSPIPEILQRVRDDLHTITRHCVNIYFLVLFCDRRQEENQPPLRFEHRTREKDEVRDEFGKFVRFCWWNVRLISPVAKVLEVRSDKTHREADGQHPRAAMNVWVRSATISRVFFLPRRFAPARTPSIRGDG